MMKFNFCKILKRKHVSKDMMPGSSANYITKTEISSNGDIKMKCIYLCKYCYESILTGD
jgi:hypothetical protein